MAIGTVTILPLDQDQDQCRTKDQNQSKGKDRDQSESQDQDQDQSETQDRLKDESKDQNPSQDQHADQEGGPGRAYLDHFYTFEEGDIEVDETPAGEKVLKLKIAAWTLPESEQLRKMNLGTEEEPKSVQINAHISPE